MPDMHLHLATATRVDSKVFIGPTQFQRTGYSNLIALRLRNAPYVNPLGEYTVRVGTYDSDWQLDRVVNTYVHTALLSASEVEIPFDITAMAFDVQITGQFDLQLVRLTGLAGAKF
jgi:hypothetical protein